MDASQLDAVSAVLGAIAASAGAGAVEAVKDTTKGAITGTRDGLVAMVRRRLKKDPLGEARLTVYAAEPTPANGQALQAHLVDAGVGQDPEIEALAREILGAAGPAALAPGSVAATVITQVNKGGGTGFIGGQHVHHHGTQPAPQVTWELFRLEGTGYELRNSGTAPATDVAIDANVSLHWPTPPDRDIPAGSSVIFVHTRRMSEPSPMLTVSCSGQPPWKRPFPR